MKYCLIVFGFLCLNVTHGQISEQLLRKMEATPLQHIPVRVNFNVTVDLVALQNQFQLESTPLENRQRILNRVLIKQAENSQAEAKKLLRDLDKEAIKSGHFFYICNVLVAEVTPHVIWKLAQLHEVNYIDWAGDTLVINDPIIQSSVHKTEAINGKESGLAAINAPAMWQLGYTGRGTKVYNYDTGVWPNHPAFRDRFLGNFTTLNESWYGLLHAKPDGRIGNHGTHTLGTIAGLDTANNDTIGVAFGTYWMANDFVASTVALLPPLADMLGAFEWALNPDGDTTTTHDIPDVINNSWRWRDDPDTVHCGGFIVQLMNAIETAGIANVFSGGNSGPSNSSVSSPQRINTSKANTFSVGSVDGNQAFPYPISNFSTRGPSQCPATGNLSIHPEVVAPGQNVRSAWGFNGYNTISGTSMAAPHVSGAILLLKEAFPQLTGAQLLQALYTSAVDLGANGEDNIFGNGMIDVHAAFQLLSVTYTPVNPNTVNNDVAIQEILLGNRSELVCATNINPKVIVQNLGNQAITSINITYWLDGVLLSLSPITLSTPLLKQHGDFDTLVLPNPITLISGNEQELKIRISTTNPDYDLVNNQRIVRFNTRLSVVLPFIEDFENGINASEWFVKNEDVQLTWDTTNVSGWSGNRKAAYLNFKQYSPAESQQDELWSKPIVIPNGAAAKLSFDVAYQQPGTISFMQDTLKISVSTDCGESFTQEIYNKSDATLTTTGTTGSVFIPASQSDWRRETIDMSAFAGKEIIVAFIGVNRRGNNLYLDNISLYDVQIDPLSTAQEPLKEFAVFPNPGTDYIKINALSNPSIELNIQVYNVNGRQVFEKKNYSNNSLLNLKALSKGLYTVRISNREKTEFVKFIKL